jgi:hypothetical protein
MAALALALAVAAAPASYAQEEGATESAVSVSAGIDLTNAYYYRGIPQENAGFILQPYGELGVDLGSVVEGLSASVGVWNSFHEQRTGATGGNAYHYELDIYAGVSMDIPGVEGLSTSVKYTALTSPNGAFGTVHELAIGATYSMAVGAGINVEAGATIVFELQGSSDAVDEGIYVQFDVTPSYELTAIEDMPITLSAPISLGLGSEVYEQLAGTVGADGTATTMNDDDNFGFLTLGVKAELPIPGIPAQFGSWKASGGVTLWILGSNNAHLAGDSVQVVATVGIAWEQ